MKPLALALTLLVGAALGAFGYHIYLKLNPKAGAQYTMAAYNQAQETADREAIQVYVRNVATVIGAARVDTPTIALPRDCADGYALSGFTARPATPLATCTVTTDAAGKYVVEARSVAGTVAAIGPF